MQSWMAKKKIGDLQVIGRSVAGVETVVAAPELNVCFDVGRAPTEIISIDNVCLSHGHMDHSAGIAYYLSQRGFIGAGPGRIIVARELAQPIQALMGTWADIEGHHSPGEILGVDAGEDVSIRRDLLVRPFTVNHGAFALGFSVIEVRRKLKAEYTDLSGPQLVELKKKGIQIQHRIEIPLIAYCGDTALGAFLDDPSVCNAKIAIIECTFFDQEHITRARAGRHMHVRDFPEVMERIKSPDVVVTHLSQRTDMRVARRVMDDTLSEADRARITILMERPPRKPRSAAPPPK